MQITDKIFALKHNFQIPVAPGKNLDRFVYSYIIIDKKITLIDSGVMGAEKRIYEFIRQSGRSIGDIETLILSHAHPDHIGAAGQIKKDTQCEVVAHELERNFIEDIELQNQQRPVPRFYDLVSEPVDVDITIEDNEMLIIGNDIDLRMVHTPGHSPGLLSILFLGKDILFSGDAIPIPNDIPNYDNYHQLISSIERIKATKEFNTLISSWADPVFGRDEIFKCIQSGTDYLKKNNSSVTKTYNGSGNTSIEYCSTVIEDLKLPAIFVNPLVNKAFLSHLY